MVRAARQTSGSISTPTARIAAVSLVRADFQKSSKSCTQLILRLFAAFPRINAAIRSN